MVLVKSNAERISSMVLTTSSARIYSRTSAVEWLVQSQSVSLLTNSAPDTKLKICLATDPQPPHPVAQPVSFVLF
jgi:hypothetical protein